VNAQEPWVSLTTEDRVLHLHQRSLRTHGGRPGGPLPGCVSAKLGAAWSAEGYIGDEAGIEGLTFATYLLFYLAKGHYFTDGNKRVGWLAMTDVLAVLGLGVRAAAEEVVSFVDQLIADTRPELARAWVTARLIEIEWPSPDGPT
jgi:prophage maintenance system killer protein